MKCDKEKKKSWKVGEVLGGYERGDRGRHNIN